MENPYKAPTARAPRTVNEDLPAAVIVMVGVVALIAMGYPLYRSYLLADSALLSRVEGAAPVIAVATFFGMTAYVLRGRRRLEAFLAQHASITGLPALEDFKDVARSDMKMVYPYLAMYLVYLTSCLLVIRQFGTPGTIAVGVLMVGHHLLGQSITSLSQEARALPAASDELDRQHKDIGQRWKKSLWPDF